MLARLTDAQEMLQATLRDFAAQRLAPGAARLDRERAFPTTAWSEAAELGLLGATAPEEHGGAALGVTELCLIAEELAHGCMASCVTVIHQAALVVDNLTRSATDEQRRRLLPGLCDGSVIGCLAITEPEAGSDALAMRTRAEPVDGGYRLNGAKTFITNGPVADLALVYAKIGGDGARDISFLAVDTRSEGFVRGPKIEKMGWRGSPTGDLAFNDVFVPEENLIGQVGDGLRILMSGLNAERLVMAAQGVGLAQAALDAATDYARARRQFGQPIADFQLVRAKLARTYAETQACRALLYECAAVADSGGAGRLNMQSAAAKLLGSETAMRATSEAVQVFGGYGYTNEYPVERMMRDAKILEIGGGTSEIQLHIIGKALAQGAATR